MTQSGDWLSAWATRQPDRIANHFPDDPAHPSMTWRTLDALANRCAQWLIGLGLAPGDGFALMMENQRLLHVLAFAAQRAGLYYTPVSIHLKPNEIAHVMRDSGARMLLVSAAAAETAAAIVAAGAAGDARLFMADGTAPGYDSFDAAIAEYPAPAPLPDRPVGREFLYSSGTTGLPKGIRRPLVPAAERNTPLPMSRRQRDFGADTSTVYLSPAPLYHAAPHRFTIETLEGGGSNVIMRRFDAERTLALIERFRVTHAQFVPTMFIRLLALPDDVKRRYDVSSLRIAVHAAAPCPIPVKRAMIEWWGPILYEYYAGSESVGGTVITSDDWLAHPGSVGRAPETPIHITGPDGEELPTGEIGAIWFEGGSRFAYHNDPTKTAAAFHPRGWGTYGDVGHVDAEGYLYLSDRRTDLILSGGVNIYPQEIETALERHPSVAEAAVIGLPDPEFGQRVAAYVRLRDGADADSDALAAHCRAELANLKCPKSIEFVDEMPRSETGKLLRRVLRAAAEARAGAGSAPP